MTIPGSSGDLSADRRYQWAQGALADRDFEGARDLFAQALELAPTWTPALFGLGLALEGLNRKTEALEAYRGALKGDPADASGAGLRIAHLSGAAPASAPRAYVTTLFDQYAAKFDRHLVEKLAYRGPEILAGAIERAAPDRVFDHLVDLGCGGGLFAATFRARVGKATGVDLSPAMIAQARTKNLYDRLAAAELVEFLQGEPPHSADLAVAADVFVYMGDLAPVFHAVEQLLRPGGLFAFTTQSGPQHGFVVGDDSRFAHSEGYLRACAAGAGLEVLELGAATTRRDRGADVPGWAAVLRANQTKP
jgi:predicted TPR repeat methyltransferase